MDAARNIIGLFDSNVENYDSWYDAKSGRAVLETEAEMLRRVLPRGLGVEIGSGTCRFSELLREERDIVCLDPSLRMLRHGYTRGRCIFPVAGVAEDTPLRSSYFSFAYMVTVIEFLHDPAMALKETWRILKPGGVLAVLFIERESSWGKFYMEIARKGIDPILARARLYTAREVDELLAASGFQVQKHLMSLAYPPLTVPPALPEIYEEACSDCGVTLTVAAKPKEFI
ncbi:methyltransferase type 11 [Thermofilum adornatum 1505]|uniref:Methyltransferase type 11 n=1 Tax=Thermofilum adornatum 1505 TaxID=697581 RepID=A0A3G1A4K0_9CREN|nr:class I SAM-dependent methyltransferase [Thermofilum adornatum]AJB41440.1 methyltransferase type 11 [Thermofilum adornatum 1505]